MYVLSTYNCANKVLMHFPTLNARFLIQYNIEYTYSKIRYFDIFMHNFQLTKRKLDTSKLHMYEIILHTTVYFIVLERTPNFEHTKH